MVMPMMNIGIVRVSVFGRRMRVEMGMRLPPVPAGGVQVPVMGIVEMRVLVFQKCVTMKMGMVFHQMKPHARPHQESGCYHGCG